LAGTNEISQQVRAARNASKVHLWPKECGNNTAEDLAMYIAGQGQRSHKDWSPLDLISLGNLAKMQADLVREHDQLRAEGSIIFGGKSGLTKIANPRCRVVTELGGSVNSISRRLGLTHTSQADGRSRANRSRQEREVRDARDDNNNRNQSLI
jgi:hypothetical protein